MTKLLFAALMAAALGTAAEAATPQDQAWIDKMNFAVNDALNGSNEAPGKVGVVYVRLAVDAQGHAHTLGVAQSCGCPDLDRAAIDALDVMQAPRPPADLAGKQILVRAVFKDDPVHELLTHTPIHCG